MYTKTLTNSESHTAADLVACTGAHTVTDTKPDPESHA